MLEEMAQLLGLGDAELGSGDPPPSLPPSPMPPPPSPPPPMSTWENVRADLIGFSLVLAASLGICGSLNLQKLVHVRNTDALTGEPIVNFLTLPLWWVGSLLNAASELLNLAALGWAPATLVTPLGCLTVVFNAIASHVFLKEPFLRRDVLGFLFILVGVICVVSSQVNASQDLRPPKDPCIPLCEPITPDCLLKCKLTSVSFWLLVAGVLVSLAVLYFGFHEKYCQRSCWIYLGESSLISTFTVLSARCFASFLPSPMPGKVEYFYKSPDCYITWGSLIILALTAVAGLLLQNAALMNFKASEVVPIYFCMFALAGVAGSGLAFGELVMPYVLLLFPGVGFCTLGVFAISHRRDERIAERIADRATVDAGHAVSGHHSGRSESSAGFGGAGGAGGTSARASALADSWRGASELSCASVASLGALEEAAFMSLGGMSMGATLSAFRMSSIGHSAPSSTGHLSSGSLTSSLLAHQSLSSERVNRLNNSLGHGRPESAEALPICRESEASSAGQRATADEEKRETTDEDAA